ncbi:hypothetical protein E2C01_068445 [Portunus trituberculatus]|uniref:Uncharacterized protein n=1 Tax=Portunus trituberculatus TaxID=210409 RepID=A0A5B7HWG9_PORTR|nr:hypothetical protein [Portunus trituberculatus]
MQRSETSAMHSCLAAFFGGVIFKIIYVSYIRPSRFGQGHDVISPPGQADDVTMAGASQLPSLPGSLRSYVS